MDVNEHETHARSARRREWWAVAAVGLVAIVLLGTVVAVAAVGGMGPGGTMMQRMMGDGDMDEMHARCHGMMEGSGNEESDRLEGEDARHAGAVDASPLPQIVGLSPGLLPEDWIAATPRAPTPSPQ